MRAQGFEFPASSFKFQISSFVPSCRLRVASCGLRVSSYELRVGSANFFHIDSGRASPSLFRKKPPDVGFSCPADAALGDETGHQAGGRHVEGIVDCRTALRWHQHAAEDAVRAALNIADFIRVAFLHGYLFESVTQLPVESARGEGHVEGHPVVAGRQGLEIGADLVGHVAGAGGAVGADDDDVHQAVLHEVPSGVVGDQRVGNAVLGQLPGRQAGALVERTGLVDPDVNRYAAIMGGVNRGGGRTVFDAGQPAGIAVGQHVDGTVWTCVRGWP